MIDLPQAPGIAKEREKIPPAEFPSHGLIIEQKVSEELTKEAEEAGYLERVEKEVELRKPVIGPQGQVLVTAPSAQQPKIVLPVSRQTYLNPKNWHLPVTMAIRWLLTWIKRIMKMYPRGTAFPNEPTT
jgi:hypothetical protein